MLSLLALTGIFQPPNDEGGYTAVPMLSDPNSSSLFVFITFPGAYDDVYEIASQIKFSNIFLVPISLNAQYVSDIHRLVTDLTPIKNVVKILYPGYYSLPVNNFNELAIIRGNGNKSTFTFPNGFISYDYNGSCDCECKKCDTLCDECAPAESSNDTHDIYVRWQDKGYLFTSINVEKNRIRNLFEKGLLDYVYVPYSDGCVDEENFISLIHDASMKDYIDSIIAYGFHTYEDFLTCYKHYPMSTPMTYRYAFVQDTLVSPTSDFDPVIGTKYFCPAIFFSDYEPENRDPMEDGTPVEKYSLPTEITNLPESPDPDVYAYKTIEIPVGTAAITRKISHDEIPFELYFHGYATHKLYKAPESSDTLVETIDNASISWDDVNGGYLTPNLDFIDIDCDSNRLLVTSGDTLMFTLFNSSNRYFDTDKQLIRYTEIHLFATYLDIIEGIDEPDMPPPMEPGDVDISEDNLINEEDIDNLFEELGVTF